MKDMSQMIERYIKLLQHFPVVFNTSRLRKISQDLSAKVKFANLVRHMTISMNLRLSELANYTFLAFQQRGVFPVNLSSSVDQLLILQGALVMYTNQILKVFGDSRLVKQLLVSCKENTASVSAAVL